MFFCFLISLTSCGSQETKHPSRRIIGERDLVPVSWHQVHPKILHSVGQMQLGCTVTHIGKGIAITAGHCFSQSHFQGIIKDQRCSNDKFKTFEKIWVEINDLEVIQGIVVALFLLALYV